MSFRRCLWRRCVGLGVKGADAWAASAVCETQSWWCRGAQADEQEDRPTGLDLLINTRARIPAEGHDCRGRTGTMRIALTPYRGYHDNPIHPEVGGKSHEMQERGGGTGELSACVLVL